jgi:hypothetical protein
VARDDAGEELLENNELAIEDVHTCVSQYFILKRDSRKLAPGFLFFVHT